MGLSVTSKRRSCLLNTHGTTLSMVVNTPHPYSDRPNHGYAQFVATREKWLAGSTYSNPELPISAVRRLYSRTFEKLRL